MVGWHRKLLTAFVGLGVAAICGSAAEAFDNRVVSQPPEPALEQHAPSPLRLSNVRVGYARTPSGGSDGPQGANAGAFDLTSPSSIGIADQGSRGPTSVDVKTALGVYQKNREGYGSRELMLTPMPSGVVVGVKLSW